MTVRDFYERAVAMGEDSVDTPITLVERAVLDRHRVQAVRVLDLGCGAGANTLSLFSGHPDVEVIGLDLSVRSAGTFRTRTGRPAVVGSGEALPFGTGTLDLVVCNDVIEHVLDPDLFVEEIRRVLRPGGHLLLSTPNLAAWFNRLALLVGVQPAFSEVSYRGIFGRPGKDVVGHLRLYTPRALRPFLEFHRFTVVEACAAPWRALPRQVQPLDRLLARSTSLGGITIVLARPS